MKRSIKDTEVGLEFTNRARNLFFVSLLLSVACSSTPSKIKESHKIPLKTAQRGEEPFQVGPYTRLLISVYDEPELTQEVTVLPDGTIDYAYLGKMNVKGLALPQVEKKITEVLNEYLVYPRVSVKLREMGVIYVFGEVKNPGILALREQQTPLEVIADAGGFSSRARKKSVEVVRTIAGEKRNFLLSFKKTEGGGVELLKTLYLQPGDTVIVE